MKLVFRLISCLIIFISSSSSGQIITTVDSIGLYDVGFIVFDKIGNLYFSSSLGNRVGKIDTNHLTTFIAGNGTHGFSGDGGPATGAELATPEGIALDTGNNNLFIADQQNQRIRKVNLISGIINTVAGMGPGGAYSGGYSGDNGPASSAQLNIPTDIKFDKNGNLYIADSWNYRIRKINVSGIITTIAGNGICGKIGNGGPVTNSELYYPSFLAIDDFGNIYVASDDYTIRKISSTGIIDIFAGDTSSNSYFGDNIPATAAHIWPTLMCFNYQGLLVVSDEHNNRILLIDGNGFIHSVAGNGVVGETGDNGPAISAEIYPSGLAFDMCENLFLGQIDNPRIRKVTFNTACIPAKVPEIVSNDLVIYPNPIENELSIDNIKASGKYSIVNITGIIKQSGTLKKGTNTINIQALPNGLYMLVIADEEGLRTVTKVVKE